MWDSSIAPVPVAEHQRSLLVKNSDNKETAQKGMDLLGALALATHPNEAI